MRQDPLIWALAIAAPLVAVGLFHAWTHVQTLRLGYELSDAVEKREVLEEQNRALRMERSTLRAPERLERLGREMKLAPPGSEAH
ncbi:MAG: cell division protein FtsL [Myxococcota bacterium]